MAQNELEIIIDAKVQGGVKGVQDTVVALNKMPAAAAKASAGIDKVAKATGSATNVLSNFGRVAQDAAFGPAAIANNLNPLVESFGRLKKETGSTGGALKALAGDLIGGGGVGFAISAVTAALSFASVGLAMWGKKSKEAKEKTDEFTKSLNDARAGAMSTGIELKSFVDIAKDTTRPLEERNEALRQANKIMGEHGEKLTLVNVGTKAATEQVNLFTQALINQALAAKFADKIADLMLAQSAATKKYTETLNAYTKAVQDAKKAESVTVSGGTGGVGGLGNVSSAAMTAAALGRAEDAAEAYKDTTKELNETYAEFNSLQSKAVQGFGALGTKQKESHERFKQQIEDIEALRKSFSTGFQGLTGLAGLLVDARLHFKQDQIKKDIQDVQDFVNRVNNPVLVPVQLRMDTNIQEEYDEILAQIEAFQARIRAVAGDLSAILKDIQVNAVVGFSEGIVNVLSGIGNPFSSFINVIADGLIQLGKYMISTSTLMIELKEAAASLITNPVAGLIVGAAMVALGTLIKSKVGQHKFAEGGIVSGPTNAMIGEAGQSEVVLPLSRLSGMLSNNRGAVVLETRVSGQDLLLVQARATASQGRTFR